jgi:hypothetical protein
MHSKTDLRNFLMAEVDVKVAVSLGRAQSHCLVAEGFAYAEGAVAEGDPASGIEIAHNDKSLSWSLTTRLIVSPASYEETERHVHWRRPDPAYAEFRILVDNCANSAQSRTWSLATSNVYGIISV